MIRSLLFAILTAVMLTATERTFAIDVARTDPGRVLVIKQAQQSGEKALKSQQKAQALNTAGHIGIKEMVEGDVSFQREFYDYLNKFHNALAVAAEIYGLYYETKQTAKHVSNISKLIDNGSIHPENFIAVAISSKRNAIYGRVIRTSLDVLEDVRKLAFGNTLKTQAEQIAILNGIRPKLRKLNGQLRELTFALYYTTLVDVWREVMGHYYRLEHAGKKDIPLRCKRDWIDNAKAIHTRAKSSSQP